MKKILVMIICVSTIIFAASCASPQSSNPEHIASITLTSSDIELGYRIEVEGKFSNKEYENGYAMKVLTSAALKDTDYDFIFMPRLERDGSMVRLYGRPARLKRSK